MNRTLILLIFVVFAVLLRLVPHPPNFAPITALALFSGITFRNKFLGAIVPLSAMLISDIFLGFYSISIWVYGAFVAVNLFGSNFKTVNTLNILISSLIFFIISNFGVWVLGYPKTLEGLILCYSLAIPFFAYSILGDFFFSYVLKYSFKFIENRWAIVKS